MLKRAMLSIAVLCGFALAPVTARPPCAWADTPTTTVTDAGSGSSAHVVPASAAAAPNPIEQPAQAWSDEKAAQKVGWPLAIWLALVMLGKALAYGRDKVKGWPVIGKLAARLAVGKGAMIVAAVGAVGAAGYDVLVNGGTWVAALVTSVAALGGVMHSTTKGAPAKTTGGGAASPSPS